MKKSLFVALSLALITSAALAQQDRSESGTKSDAAVARPVTAKSLVVFGRVSRDGRSLLTDLDSEWTVSNAEALRGREGSLVTVKCYVDPDHSQIHVLSVRNVQSGFRFDPR
jgi:hypothetical protein